jgi:hypothetical protein
MPGCITLGRMKRPNQNVSNAISRRWVIGLAAAAFAGAAGPEPVPIAVLDLDYVDQSGEVRDQQQQHQARLQRFAESLRTDLANSGRYRIVHPTCNPAPCTGSGPDPESLTAAARKAGATLMMFGGVHKESTLIQWAKLLVVDVQSNKLVFDRLITFRGDDDESWKRAEAFSAAEFLKSQGSDSRPGR